VKKHQQMWIIELLKHTITRYLTLVLNRSNAIHCQHRIKEWALHVEGDPSFWRVFYSGIWGSNANLGECLLEFHKWIWVEQTDNICHKELIPVAGRLVWQTIVPTTGTLVSPVPDTRIRVTPVPLPELQSLKSQLPIL